MSNLNFTHFIAVSSHFPAFIQVHVLYIRKFNIDNDFLNQSNKCVITQLMDTRCLCSVKSQVQIHCHLPIGNACIINVIANNSGTFMHMGNILCPQTILQDITLKASVQILMFHYSLSTKSVLRFEHKY